MKKVSKKFGGLSFLSTFATSKQTNTTVNEGHCLKGKANAGIAQLVEHNLAKVGVAGPSPVSRSKFPEKSGFFLFVLSFCVVRTDIKPD